MLPATRKSHPQDRASERETCQPARWLVSCTWACALNRPLWFAMRPRRPSCPQRDP